MKPMVLEMLPKIAMAPRSWAKATVIAVKEDLSRSGSTNDKATTEAASKATAIAISLSVLALIFCCIATIEPRRASNEPAIFPRIPPPAPASISPSVPLPRNFLNMTKRPTRRPVRITSRIASKFMFEAASPIAVPRPSTSLTNASRTGWRTGPVLPMASSILPQAVAMLSRIRSSGDIALVTPFS